MESREVTYIAPRPILGSVLVALVVGAALPVVALVQISLLLPTLMLGGLMATRLCAKAGWPPLAALAAAALVSSGRLLGATPTMILLTASLLPSLPVIVGMAKKKPFFEQMNTGVMAYAFGLLAALLMAYASYGGGMIARFVDLLRAEYARMPDTVLQPMVDWVNAMLNAGATQGMSVTAFRSQLSGVLDLMQQTYAQVLPGALLSGALLSGILSVLWGNWTMARRGMASSASFVGMSGWFMPARFSLGAVGLWLAGLILMATGAPNGATVNMTISQTAGAAFAVQALCAMNRRLLRADRPLGRRRLLIALMAIAALLLRGAGAVLAYIGVASALFGSRGALRRDGQKPGNGQSNQDDSDE